MTTLFVTSTGTGIGKTFVTAQLVRELLGVGMGVRALKPVASGFDPTRVEQSDTGLLLAAQGLALTDANVAATSPWTFAAPLSADMAAAREQRTIDFDALVAFSLSTRGADVTLIEGVGGVMAPLDAERTVLDWIAALRAPALLVVGSYLGTLSHTLTAAAALARRGVSIAGVIVSESLEQPVSAEETAGVLARFLAPTPLLVLPRAAYRPLRALIAPLLRER
jgi:dethiobiotin synthetase